MTKSRESKVVCPGCGNEQLITIWTAIDLGINPELRESLFKARINVFECEKCEKRLLIGVPLLYHDPAKKFCVQYFPPENMDEDLFLNSFIENGVIVLERLPREAKSDAEYIRNAHIVFDMKELQRYILFREKLFTHWQKQAL